jgi:hypothetical protein
MALEWKINPMELRQWDWRDIQWLRRIIPQARALAAPELQLAIVDKAGK